MEVRINGDRAAQRVGDTAIRTTKVGKLPHTSLGLAKGVEVKVMVMVMVGGGGAAHFRRPYALGAWPLAPSTAPEEAKASRPPRAR